MTSYETIKKFERLFRTKYETMLDTQNHWYEYLVSHGLNKEVEWDFESNDPNWILVRPWPDIPFIIPRDFFEKVLLLGFMP